MESTQKFIVWFKSYVMQLLHLLLQLHSFLGHDAYCNSRVAYIRYTRVQATEFLTAFLCPVQFGDYFYITYFNINYCCANILNPDYDHCYYFSRQMCKCDIFLVILYYSWSTIDYICLSSEL